MKRTRRSTSRVDLQRAAAPKETKNNGKGAKNKISRVVPQTALQPSKSDDNVAAKNKRKVSCASTKPSSVVAVRPINRVMTRHRVAVAISDACALEKELKAQSLEVEPLLTLGLRRKDKSVPLIRPDEPAVQPQVVQPQVVEPHVVEPQVVKPQVVEPQVVQSQVVQPQVVEPQAEEPQASGNKSPSPSTSKRQHSEESQDSTHSSSIDSGGPSSPLSAASSTPSDFIGWTQEEIDKNKAELDAAVARVKRMIAKYEKQLFGD